MHASFPQMTAEEQVVPEFYDIQIKMKEMTLEMDMVRGPGLLLPPPPLSLSITLEGWWC